MNKEPKSTEISPLKNRTITFDLQSSQGESSKNTTNFKRCNFNVEMYGKEITEITAIGMMKKTPKTSFFRDRLDFYCKFIWFSNIFFFCTK